LAFNFREFNNLIDNCTPGCTEKFEIYFDAVIVEPTNPYETGDFIYIGASLVDDSSLRNLGKDATRIIKLTFQESAYVS
jgi:hypothetical protein